MPLVLTILSCYNEIALFVRLFFRRLAVASNQSIFAGRFLVCVNSIYHSSGYNRYMLMPSMSIVFGMVG